MRALVQERKTRPSSPPTPPTPPKTAEDATHGVSGTDVVSDSSVRYVGYTLEGMQLFDSRDGLHMVSTEEYVQTCLRVLQLAEVPVDRLLVCETAMEYFSRCYPDGWYIDPAAGLGDVLELLKSKHGVRHRRKLGKVDGKSDFVLDHLSLS